MLAPAPEVSLWSAALTQHSGCEEEAWRKSAWHWRARMMPWASAAGGARVVQGSISQISRANISWASLTRGPQSGLCVCVSDKSQVLLLLLLCRSAFQQLECKEKSIQ